MSPSLSDSGERVVAWAGFTGYVLATAFVAVFPEAIPVDGAVLKVPVALTIVAVAGALALAREAPRPGLVLVAVPLFVLAALDVIKACPDVLCPTPPGYEPWRHVELFVRWSPTGPALGVSSDPGRCAAMCPHRIELVPLALGYVAVRAGFRSPAE